MDRLLSPAVPNGVLRDIRYMLSVGLKAVPPRAEPWPSDFTECRISCLRAIDKLLVKSQTDLLFKRLKTSMELLSEDERVQLLVGLTEMEVHNVFLCHAMGSELRRLIVGICS